MMEQLNGGRLRVVKLGGSLLDWPEFPGQLRLWLRRQPPATNVLLVGGGEFADVIRRADTCHSLGEYASHHLCIQTLQVTAQMAAQLLPEARGPLRLECIEPAPNHSLVLLDVPALIELDTARSVRPLPASWEVTTDSIAARAAVLLKADELVLLKSDLVDRPGSLTELAAAGLVDGHFPVCAKSIANIRLVNLRSANFLELIAVEGGRPNRRYGVGLPKPPSNL